jgi:uncharacterized membrane protein (UPF0127 family)
MRWLVSACVALWAFAAVATPLSRPLQRSSLVVDTPHGPARFLVEIAADNASRMKGLMFRKEMPPDSGMLFEFPDDHFRSFWMKNTILPLDMLFIRADGTISSIAQNTTPYSLDVVTSREPVRAVLEINAGRSAALGITAGEKVHGAFFGQAASGQ